MLEKWIELASKIMNNVPMTHKRKVGKNKEPLEKVIIVFQLLIQINKIIKH
jgi:hypothetical protein